MKQSKIAAITMKLRLQITDDGGGEVFKFYTYKQVSKIAAQKNKTSDHRSQAMKSMRHGIATNHRITISLSPPCLNQRMYQLGGAVLFLLELIAVHLPTRTLR